MIGFLIMVAYLGFGLAISIVMHEPNDPPAWPVMCMVGWPVLCAAAFVLAFFRVIGLWEPK